MTRNTCSLVVLAAVLVAGACSDDSDARPAAVDAGDPAACPTQKPMNGDGCAIDGKRCTYLVTTCDIACNCSNGQWACACAGFDGGGQD